MALKAFGASVGSIHPLISYTRFILSKLVEGLEFIKAVIQWDPGYTLDWSGAVQSHQSRIRKKKCQKFCLVNPQCCPKEMAQQITESRQEKRASVRGRKKRRTKNVGQRGEKRTGAKRRRGRWDWPRKKGHQRQQMKKREEKMRVRIKNVFKKNKMEEKWKRK